MKKQTKAILVAPLALATMFSGCKTGMFAPRTGELFQTTRMGTGGTDPCDTVGGVVVLG